MHNSNGPKPRYPSVSGRGDRAHRHRVPERSGNVPGIWRASVSCVRLETVTPRGPTGAGTTARPVTRYLPAAVLLVIIASDALVTWTGVQKPPANPWLLAFVVSDSVVAPFVGLFIVRRHPGHPVGWLLVLHGLFVVTLLGSEPVTQFMTAHHIAPTSVAVWDQAGSGLWPLLYLCIALVAYIFPDGHFLSRRWRIFVAICLGGYLLFFVSAALNIKQFDGMRNPPLPTLPPPVVAPGVALGLLAIAASLIGAVVAAGARLRQAAGEERVRLLWVLLAAVTVPVGLAGAWLVQLVSGSGLLVDAGVCVTGVVVPIAIGVGILRHRLFDIELVVSRTLTYGALTALVIGILCRCAGRTGRGAQPHSGRPGRGRHRGCSDPTRALLAAPPSRALGLR